MEKNRQRPIKLTEHRTREGKASISGEVQAPNLHLMKRLEQISFIFVGFNEINYLRITPGRWLTAAANS